jgi:broad specificity phosphatase PhoE
MLFVAHAETDAMRRGVLAFSDGLSARGLRTAERLAGSLPLAPAFATSSPAARETAQALGVEASEEPTLADLDLGRWANRALADIAAADADAAEAWLADPSFRAHGGESLTDFIERVAAWLGTRLTSGPSLAIASPAVVRAAAVAALTASPAVFWRLDVSALTLLALHSDGQRWALRELRPLASRAPPA